MLPFSDGTILFYGGIIGMTIAAILRWGWTACITC